MAKPDDVIVPMLREMREENKSRFDHVDQKLADIEGRQKSFSNALTTDTIMSKFMLGDYGERLAELEAKVAKLSGQQ